MNTIEYELYHLRNRKKSSTKFMKVTYSFEWLKAIKIKLFQSRSRNSSFSFDVFTSTDLVDLSLGLETFSEFFYARQFNDHIILPPS